MTRQEIDQVNQYLDGTISDEDFARLQENLRQSAELRRLLRDLATIDSKLTEIAAINPETLRILQPPDAREAYESRFSRALWNSVGVLAASILLALVGVWAAWAYSAKEKPRITQLPQPPLPVRAAVIGAITGTDIWEKICTQFEKSTGRQLFVAYTGDRELCEDAFRKGRADVLIGHANDDTAKLISDGFGMNNRAWAYNDMMIAGPIEDPAGIRGMESGAEAMKRIAETQSPYFDFKGSGSREVARNLWKAAGLEEPEGDWVLKDEGHDKWASMRFAEDRGAYVIVGRLPAHARKIPKGNMEVLVQGDPAMRRPLIVMEANSKRFPTANGAGAHAFADFLLSKEIQKLLSEYGAEAFGGFPYFPPVNPPHAQARL